MIKKKSMKKTSVKGSYLNLLRTIYDKSSASITLQLENT